MSETCKQESFRNEAGRFVKGHSGNPTGINGWTKLDSILQAIKYKGKCRGTGFEKHIADRFYINDAVLMAVLKKAIPELRQVEHSGKIEGSETKIIIIRPELKKEEIVEDGGNGKTRRIYIDSETRPSI